MTERQAMNFVNLTNGIEAIPGLPPGWHACRIQSTAIEHRDWAGLVNDLDHNLLFWLSQGARCVVHDFGCRRPTSKVISVGVPLIKGLLEWAWLQRRADAGFLPEAIRDVLEEARDVDEQRAKRKVRYYRKILRTDAVRLEGVSRRTERDGDFDFYRGILGAAEARHHPVS